MTGAGLADPVSQHVILHDQDPHLPIVRLPR
jgi:hypothetical protein